MDGRTNGRTEGRLDRTEGKCECCVWEISLFGLLALFCLVFVFGFGL